METMRNTETQGNLERVFATVLQSLDINQDQRKRYEGVVNMFKAADEPQTKALAKERSRTGSSRQTPEDMHAMNVEDGDAECPRCTKFGKCECWQHSPIMCSVCKKRGKTCPCVRKAAKAQKGKTTPKAEPSEQSAPIESMLASLQETIFGLTQKTADMERTIATQQEEAPMAKDKQRSFDESEVENQFGMIFEIEAGGSEEGSVSPNETTQTMVATEDELESRAAARFYFGTENPEGDETIESKSPG